MLSARTAELSSSEAARGQVAESGVGPWGGSARVSTGRATILHLTASPSYGGSERQMLELGRELMGRYRSVYVTFREEERCWDFVRQAQVQGFEAVALKHDTPRLFGAFRELVGILRASGASVLFCHGYKSGLLGRLAGRKLGIPVIAVSHGWTGESLRVRLFDWIDRVNLRWMDEVVCVSEGQARKVRRCGVPSQKVRVVRDAVRTDRFASPEAEYRSRLESLFPDKPEVIVGAAGRLSPEKGYRFLVDAAADVLRQHPNTGFVLFGDGPLREEIARRAGTNGLGARFQLPGFCRDLDGFLPHFDLFVLPSLTEGLPNVVLEAFAARVPVVATAVGGTPEVVEDGVNGYLVPPGKVEPLADRIVRLVCDRQRRVAMGARGRRRVEEKFSFGAQAKAYEELLGRFLSRTNGARKPNGADE